MYEISNTISSIHFCIVKSHEVKRANFLFCSSKKTEAAVQKAQTRVYSCVQCTAEMLDVIVQKAAEYKYLTLGFRP